MQRLSELFPTRRLILAVGCDFALDVIFDAVMFDLPADAVPFQKGIFGARISVAGYAH